VTILKRISAIQLVIQVPPTCFMRCVCQVNLMISFRHRPHLESPAVLANVTSIYHSVLIEKFPVTFQSVSPLIVERTSGPETLESMEKQF
jgi:hypothetical protein